MYPSPLFGSYSDDMYFVLWYGQSICLLLRVGNREDLVQEEMLSPLQLIRSVPKWSYPSTPDKVYGFRGEYDQAYARTTELF